MWRISVGKGLLMSCVVVNLSDEDKSKDKLFSKMTTVRHVIAQKPSICSARDMENADAEPLFTIDPGSKHVPGGSECCKHIAPKIQILLFTLNPTSFPYHLTSIDQAPRSSQSSITTQSPITTSTKWNKVLYQTLLRLA